MKLTGSMYSLIGMDSNSQQQEENDEKLNEIVRKMLLLRQANANRKNENSVIIKNIVN